MFAACQSARIPPARVPRSLARSSFAILSILECDLRDNTLKAVLTVLCERDDLQDLAETRENLQQTKRSLD